MGNAADIHLHSEIGNLSLMNPKTARIPARIHYAASNQRKLNLGLKPNQIPDFPRTVNGVLYRQPKAKRV